MSLHRLSTTISKDDGAIWTHFRNLESLDDRVKIRPPSAMPQVYRMQNPGQRQPVDRERYKHAPGCLRVCYPSVVFHENEVAVAYDYGYCAVGTDLAANRMSTTKVKIVTLDWLYEKV